MPTLKLGSTTALTESSGALTINVANPTVTLGSNATFNAPNLGTPSAVTLTNATFPAGHFTSITHYAEEASSGNASGTYTGFGTIRSLSVENGAKVWITMIGGFVPQCDGSVFASLTSVNYKVDSTFSSGTDGTFEKCAYVIGLGLGPSGVNYKAPGTAVYLYTNSTGSTVTLYFRPAVHALTGSYTGYWGGGASNPIRITAVYLV